MGPFVRQLPAVPGRPQLGPAPDMRVAWSRPGWGAGRGRRVPGPGDRLRVPEVLVLSLPLGPRFCSRDLGVLCSDSPLTLLGQT